MVVVPAAATTVELSKRAFVVMLPLASRSTTLLAPVLVVTPVPPFATASVPANVIVPLLVIGLPDVVKPVVPPETATLVTVPVPNVAGADQEAVVPLLVRT